MKILGGKAYFYQWDHDQKLDVPAGIQEVHFFNGTAKEALACVVNENQVDVPNILLQTAADIHAYGWNTESKCVVQHAVFHLEARAKPADYVYTQTDVKSVENAVAAALQKLKDSGELTGPQGESPVRGEDYWTEEDKAEIEGYVEETVDQYVGDILNALDEIIAIQEALIGGGSSSVTIGTCCYCGHDITASDATAGERCECGNCGGAYTVCPECGTFHSSEGPYECENCGRDLYDIIVGE